MQNAEVKLWRPAGNLTLFQTLIEVVFKSQVFEMSYCPVSDLNHKPESQKSTSEITNLENLQINETTNDRLVFPIWVAKQVWCQRWCAPVRRLGWSCSILGEVCVCVCVICLSFLYRSLTLWIMKPLFLPFFGHSGDGDDIEFTLTAVQWCASVTAD